MTKRPKYMDKVWFWDDERSAGNSIIVTLRYGWRFDVNEHVMGFDTVKEARAAIRCAAKCRCKECSQYVGHQLTNNNRGGKS